MTTSKIAKFQGKNQAHPPLLVSLIKVCNTKNVRYLKSFIFVFFCCLNSSPAQEFDKNIRYNFAVRSMWLQGVVATRPATWFQ